MPGIAVVGLDSAGGTQLGGGQHFYKVEGNYVVLMGDRVASHGKDEHSGPTMAQSLSWYRIDGIGVCRQGHQATCGHASTGRSWYRVTG